MDTVIKGKRYSYKVQNVLKWTNDSVSSEESSGAKWMKRLYVVNTNRSKKNMAHLERHSISLILF